MRRVLFSGGGTGGHIYPALAIREILMKRFPDLESGYLGLSDGMEGTIVRRIPDLPFFPIRAQGMPREPSLKWLTFPFRNALGFFDAFLHLRRFSPKVVVTTGGYVAFPVLMAATVLGIPTVIHEQNAAMGVTNRLFAGRAARILLTYKEAWKNDGEKVFLTGNPVREAFNSASPPKSRFTKKAGEFWIFVVGGSRGAASLNKLCSDLSKKWLDEHPDIVLLHITGDRDFEAFTSANPAHPRHIILPYLHEMREGFEVADILVSRAGATILAEIGKCGKPAILVPFPHATDNHQEKNARSLESQGAAKVILDRDLDVAALDKELIKIRKGTSLEELGKKMAESRPPDVEERIFKAVAPLVT